MFVLIDPKIAILNKSIKKHSYFIPTYDENETITNTSAEEETNPNLAIRIFSISTRYPIFAASH